MRFAASTSALAALLAVSALQATAQEAGDLVTYTDDDVVYTASLDADLDTVGDMPFSTITPAGDGGAAETGVLSTTYDFYGNPVTISDGVTLGTFISEATTASPTPTPDSSNDDENENAGGVSVHDIVNGAVHEPTNDESDQNQPEPSKLLQFQSFEPRSPTPLPDQPNQHVYVKRQGLGGGAVPQTTQSGLQTISGYDPPTDTEIPEPDDINPGSILEASQIPGYSDKGNSNNGLGSSAFTTGSSGGVIQLSAKWTTLGAAVLGAVTFAML